MSVVKLSVKSKFEPLSLYLDIVFDKFPNILFSDYIYNNTFIFKDVPLKRSIPGGSYHGNYYTVYNGHPYYLFVTVEIIEADAYKATISVKVVGEVPDDPISLELYRKKN